MYLQKKLFPSWYIKAILIGGSAVVIYLLLTLNNNHDIIVIKPDTKDIKIKPLANRPIKNIDKSVYQAISKDQHTIPITHILPDPETPISHHNNISAIIEGVTTQPSSIFNIKSTIYSNSLLKKTYDATQKSTYYVSIAAINNPSKAEGVWEQIKNTHPILKNHTYKVIPQPVQDNRTYYQLVVDDILNIDSAKRLCKKLLGEKQECVIYKH